VRRHSRFAALAVVAVAFVAAGCAIPTQGNPSTMSASRVPFHLLDPHLPTTTTTAPKPTSLVQVKVFFLNSADQLTAAPRVVTTPAPLTAIISSLLAGPTQAEGKALSTAIPGNVAVVSTTTQDGIVTVNMNAAFGAITGNNIELAVAQIVSTIATENGLNTGVLFEIDGQRTSVPIANGSQVTEPVYLIEFLSVAP
jgi:hypothetical protein